MPGNRRNEERRSYLRLGIRRASGSCQAAATSAVSRSVRRRRRRRRRRGGRRCRRDLARLQPTSTDATKQNEEDDDDLRVPSREKSLSRFRDVVGTLQPDQADFYPVLPVFFAFVERELSLELETFLERWSLTEIRRRKFRLRTSLGTFRNADTRITAKCLKCFTPSLDLSFLAAICLSLSLSLSLFASFLSFFSSPSKIKARCD